MDMHPPYVGHMPKTANLLTSAQVAAEVGCNVKTITRKATQGLIPYTQKLDGLRGAYLFDRAIIETLKAEKDAERQAS